VVRGEGRVGGRRSCTEVCWQVAPEEVRREGRWASLVDGGGGSRRPCRSEEKGVGGARGRRWEQAAVEVGRDSRWQKGVVEV
jgi:hypothetical protein